MACTTHRPQNAAMNDQKWTRYLAGGFGVFSRQPSQWLMVRGRRAKKSFSEIIISRWGTRLIKNQSLGVISNVNWKRSQQKRRNNRSQPSGHIIDLQFYHFTCIHTGFGRDFFFLVSKSRSPSQIPSPRSFPRTPADILAPWHAVIDVANLYHRSKGGMWKAVAYTCPTGCNETCHRVHVQFLYMSL